MGRLRNAAILSLGLTAMTMMAETVREPAVAGSFYPATPEALRKSVDRYLDDAARVALPAKPRALICPHAGYIYSGPVAGWAYRQLKHYRYDLVVVIAPSHQVGFLGASVDASDRYRTVLGDLKFDRESGDVIRNASSSFHFLPAAHLSEHAVDTQTPFIKHLYPDTPIVTIVMGYHDQKVARELADALDKLLNKKDALIVCSTDLSHYHPYAEAIAKDNATIKGIVDDPPDAFFRQMECRDYELCGGGPVSALKYLIKKRGMGKPVLVKYMNSGDTAGDKSGVVGYAAIAVTDVPDTRAERSRAML